MSVVPEIQVVDEIPDAMKRMAVYITRTFYGDEHAIIMEYIKRNICIKEDTLRDITKFEPKFLRQVLIALKVDKLIKERQIVEQRPDGAKSAKLNYYFINYRAMLNVTKYKLDHMRQKLEMKEKEGTQRATFKCGNCQQSYDAMEMDRLFDPMSGEMKCWRCNNVVEEDTTVGPSDSTRSVLARFNEQLTGLFSLLQQLDGIQLAPHLLEPSLSDGLADKGTADDSNQKNQSGGSALPALGASKTGMVRYKQEVTVNIESENDANSGVTKQEEVKKEQPVWMTQHAGMSATGYNSTNIVIKTEEDYEPSIKAEMSSPQHAPLIRLHSDDLVGMSPPYKSEPSGSSEAKKVKLETSSATEDDDDDDFEDVTETTLTVNGKSMSLAEVMEQPDLVEQMTEEEKERYVALCQDAMDTMGY